jgi:hypothetical protein
MTSDTAGPTEGWQHLAEWAWSIICNAHGGDWDAARPEWKAAAEKYRAELFAEWDREKDGAA